MKKLITIILILALLLPVAVLAEDDPIVGKWSFYWDTRPMNEQYNNGKPLTSFLVNSMDLYFFADGTAYMTMAYMDTAGKFTQEYPAIDGVWMASGDGEYVANFHGVKYRITFDSEGFLRLYMKENLAYPFIHVPFYDFFAEN
jgi:hypothetical protein